MSSINLTKGQKIDLTKGNAGLKKIKAGMGWAKKGSGTIDLDASAVIVREDGSIKETISFQTRSRSDGLRYSSDNAVIHHGDDLVGGGSVNDPNEVIDIILDSVAADVKKIVIIMNTYSRGFKFKDLKNAWIAIYNADNNDELFRFTLSDDKSIADKKALIIGEFYRRDGEWKFNSLGHATNDSSIGDMERSISSGTQGNSQTSSNSSDSNSGGLFGRIGRIFS